MYNLFAIVMFELYFSNNCIMYYISIPTYVVEPHKLNNVQYFKIIDFSVFSCDIIVILR